MKTILFFAALTFSINVFSQENKQVKFIDELAKSIDNSNYLIQKDSIFQNIPAIGLSIKTYITAVSNGSELLKYAQIVEGSSIINGKREDNYANQKFYFKNNSLIKVEEFGYQDSKEIKGTYYFLAGKVLTFIPNTPAHKSRANSLIEIGNTMVKVFEAKYKNTSEISTSN